VSLAELWPHLRALPRAEKLRAIQFLAEDLFGEEQGDLLLPEGTYPIWSPWNAYEAAAELLHALQD
jgi:hypothetical protein